MIWTHRGRALLSTALAAIALCATALNADAKSKPQDDSVATSAPSADAPGATGLSPRLLEDAAAYHGHVFGFYKRPIRLAGAQDRSGL